MKQKSEMFRRILVSATFVVALFAIACGQTTSGSSNNDNDEVDGNCQGVCERYDECGILETSNSSLRECTATCSAGDISADELTCSLAATCDEVAMGVCSGVGNNGPDNNTVNNDNPNNGNTNNGDPNNGNTNNGNTNNGDPNNGNTNNGNTNNGDPNNGNGGCEENIFFTGQTFVAEDEPANSPNGGVPTTTPYDVNYDSGIGTILASLPANPTEDFTNVPLNVDVVEATVVATHFNSTNEGGPQLANTNFWISDGVGSIQVFFDSEDTDLHPTFPIKVGQKISFTVSEVTIFFGIPEITNATDWNLVSENNEVYIDDRTNGEVSLQDLNSVVRITGTLDSAGQPCGGSSLCYDLNYGGPSTLNFRSSSMFIQQDSCITFVGPVGARDGAVQLNIINFDWTWNNDQ